MSARRMILINIIILVILSKKLLFFNAQKTPIGILNEKIITKESPANFKVAGNDLSISSATFLFVFT